MTIVRAYNAAGFHMDILRISDQQVHMHVDGVKDSRHLDPPIGPRVVIRPEDFPEVVEFEIIVTEERRR